MESLLVMIPSVQIDKINESISLSWTPVHLDFSFFFLYVLVSLTSCVQQKLRRRLNRNDPIMFNKSQRCDASNLNLVVMRFLTA